MVETSHAATLRKEEASRSTRRRNLMEEEKWTSFVLQEVLSSPEQTIGVLELESPPRGVNPTLSQIFLHFQILAIWSSEFLNINLIENLKSNLKG